MKIVKSGRNSITVTAEPSDDSVEFQKKMNDTVTVYSLYNTTLMSTKEISDMMGEEESYVLEIVSNIEESIGAVRDG